MLFDIHAETERLAVLRRGPDGRHKIFLRTVQGQTLGEIPAGLLPLEPHWSPDGSTVVFGSNDGLLYIHRLGETGPKVVFANPSLQAGFCEWAADGNRLVFSAYDRVRHTPPSIFCLSLDTGHTLQLTNDPKTVDRFPHWSPSGQWVAFQRQFLDEPELPRRVYLVEVQSGRCFPALDVFEGECETARFSWSPDSSSLLVTLSHNGRVELRVIGLQDQSTAWSYESETIQRGAFSPQGDQILCICSDELLWFAYPEGTFLQRLSLASAASVWNYYTGAQIGFDLHATAVYFVGANACLYRWRVGGNCDCILQDSPPVGPAFTHEEYFVPSRDGRPIPVQRFIPSQPRSPAILYVHGGGGVIDPDDSFMLRLLAEGIEFVSAAYRGSSGYGPEHEEANRGEYGQADVWDVLAAGFDWKKRAGENRPLILAGYSYGGFLTFLALAQEETPWAGGITLWSGTDTFLHLGLDRHRAFPTDADQYAVAQVERSPLKQAGRIRVPLLIFHGALDTVATTDEMRAIQATVLSQGGECELIIFDDDTHGLMRHRDEIHARVMSFLKQLE
ncbi:MAG TPA: prolyl oligopeptidase family serine peptidase [Chloroflexota bacterium]|nr:prolyl oligopeptidase family serine peptidase [Chloroflexota bacterium]